MVFYFSGAGNSEYVARRIADAVSDTAIDIAWCMEQQRFDFDVEGSRRVGFVFPVHFWGLPAIVAEFLDRLALRGVGKCYFYTVATCGTSTGQASWMARRALLRKGVGEVASFSVKMVDTWTPMFNLTDTEKNHRREAASEKEISVVAERVVRCSSGNFDSRRLPHLIAGVYHRTYRRQRQTCRFSVLADRCVGCGRCVAGCPTHTIVMDGGLPRWEKSECTLCLRCLHHCPKFAIQYGAKTASHGQYVNPHIKDKN